MFRQRSIGGKPDKTYFSLCAGFSEIPRDRLTDAHRQFLDYWSDKAAPDGIPRRSDILPWEIPQLLPNLMLWSVLPEGGYRCQLSGSEADIGFAGPLAGHRLDDIPCSLIAEARREFNAVRDGTGFSLAERTLGWVGKPHAYYRLLLLPLAGPDGAITVLAGLVTFHSILEQPSRWQ